MDDLGWTDLGCMGSKFYETPNIDLLAKEGTLFTNAYAAAANCAPSRACMLTGLQPSRHGIYTVTNSDRGHEKTRRLIPIPTGTTVSEEIPTLGTALKDLGYDTGMIGKWHISNSPTQHGFDFNRGGCDWGHPKSYFAPYKNPTLEEGPEGEYLPERLCEEASKFISAKRDKPFFLYYATYLVHTPLQGKDDVVEKYKAKIEKGESTEEHYNPVYAAMIEALDNSLGQVMKTLDETGQRDNTLIIFLSDNGGVYEISKQTPLRAGKGSYYEGGTRVPCIARWPQKIKSGASDHTPFTNMDFFSSFVSIAGGDPGAYKLDGDDMSGLFLGKSAEDTRNLFWHFPIYLQSGQPDLASGRDALFRTRPGSTLRRGPWKLHHYYEDDAYELYHLDDDMGEQRNLIDQEADIAKEMISILKAMRSKYEMPEPTELNDAYDEEFTREKEKEAQEIEAPSPVSVEHWYKVMELID